ncbi:MAG: hypothetical protein R3Y24_13485 [Eubacteriales bacterium]
MKKFISKIKNNPKLLGALSLCLVTMSAASSNAICFAIFHDVEKPKALDSLKKY